MWGTQVKGGHKAHNTAHSSLYIWTNTKYVFVSSSLLYVYWSFCLKKKLKTVRHLSFAKSLSLSLFLIVFCVRRFLQGLQCVLMGFSVCSARFLVGSGGFLLWFLRTRNTPTFMRNTSIERVVKLFCVCKFDCKSFLNAFGLKNRI